VTAYPPRPWRLVGDLWLAVLWVPKRAVELQLPPGYRLVQLAGRIPVAVVWVAYQPGGVLSYRELLVAVPVRRGARIRVTVPGIWVDSAAAQAGGRVLWALPKEPATFADGLDGRVFASGADGRDIGAAAFRRRARLPGRWPIRFRVAQPDGQRARLSAVAASGRIEWGAASVEISPTGPLAGLAGRRPLVAAALRGFVLTFGEDAR
jgi:hypothetical protein